MSDFTEIKELIGNTFTFVGESTEKLGKGSWSDTAEGLVFKNSEEGYIFYHEQDCCEDVHIDDICGDLSDLIGSPIIRAEERSESGEEDEENGYCYGTHTWTFYEFSTIKGSVSVKWHGSSNGYYSESVNMADIKVGD